MKKISLGHTHGNRQTWNNTSMVKSVTLPNVLKNYCSELLDVIIATAHFGSPTHIGGAIPCR